jgi:hypothetical protein
VAPSCRDEGERGAAAMGWRSVSYGEGGRVGLSAAREKEQGLRGTEAGHHIGRKMGLLTYCRRGRASMVGAGTNAMGGAT